MKLLVNPGDGVMPIINGINAAKSTVEIMIFRFDRAEIERALANAVKRGVLVHALVAHVNRAGEENLRKLELALLAAGVTVGRTAGDLLRYHGKMMIIDRRILYVFAFNFTYADIERSRSFGIVTGNPKVVQEAVKLFEADAQRHSYQASQPGFVVSPTNSRKQLSAFIAKTKKQLLIYDPKISDPLMIRLLEERAKAGVDVRIIGRLTRRSQHIKVHKLPRMRLHTRTMIQDGRQAFIGSMSLREVELDGRREVGLIFRDAKIISQLLKVFQEDWAEVERVQSPEPESELAPVEKAARKVAKVVAKELPPVTPVLDAIVQEITGSGTGGVELDVAEVEANVKDAVKEAVREVVQDAIAEVVEET